jgi:hypothetical protein
VFEFKFELRSTESFIDYSLLADIANEERPKKDLDVFGIKGSCCFTGIIALPQQAPYDFMHLVLQGHVRWLLNRYFASEKAKAYNLSMNLSL